jgi:hypothetical protein
MKTTPTQKSLLFRVIIMVAIVYRYGLVQTGTGTKSVGARDNRASGQSIVDIGRNCLLEIELFK